MSYKKVLLRRELDRVREDLERLKVDLTRSEERVVAARRGIDHWEGIVEELEDELRD